MILLNQGAIYLTKFVSSVVILYENICDKEELVDWDLLNDFEPRHYLKALELVLE